MVKQVRPAVVRIQTSSRSGSGVIFETQGQTGYVITNHHVVEGDVQVSVIVNDSTTYSGSVLGTDSVRDLAVVSICCGSFRDLPFGNAAALQPGDEVVAIGYALGLPGQATVTRGIVSAVRYDSTHRSDVIQTDAAINPGNSGGPMLSMSGKILGINTFGYEKTQSGRPVEGLNFAISGTTVQQQIPILSAGTPAPTPTPTRSPTATPIPGRTSSFGPTSGELRHDPSDGLIKTEYADVGDDEYTDVASGYLSGAGINLLSRNHLLVIAFEESGWFFVNDRLVAKLDLGHNLDSGQVSAMGDFFLSHQGSPSFENFNVWAP